MPNQLSPEEYAKLLCETIGQYHIEPVTYNFTDDNNQSYNDDNPFQKDYKNPHMRNNDHLNSPIFCLENYMNKLFYGDTDDEIKNGLLNILYLVSSLRPNQQYGQINEFYKIIQNDNEQKIYRLKNHIETWKDNNTDAESKIRSIHNLSIPRFKSGIMQVSLLLMFLDPGRYPALNDKIILSYQDSFIPFKDFLRDKQSCINYNRKKLLYARVYENWVCKCREIATALNQIHDSPCQNIIRAADVERFLYKNKNSDGRSIFLAGPKESICKAPDNITPACRVCGNSKMLLRPSSNTNSNFWWCFNYPKCPEKKSDEYLIKTLLGKNRIDEARDCIVTHLNNDEKFCSIVRFVRKWAISELSSAEIDFNRIYFVLDTLSSHKFNRDVSYLKGIAFRMEGNFKHAHKEFESLVNLEDPPNDIWVQQALIRSRISHITELYILPRQEERNTFVQSIRSADDEINRAVDNDNPSPIALILMALPDVLSYKANETQQTQLSDSKENLRKSIRIIQQLGGQRHENEDDFESVEINSVKEHLLASARFYSIFLELRIGEIPQARGNDLVNDLNDLFQDPRFPSDLEIEAVRWALLELDDSIEGVDQLVINILDRHPYHTLSSNEFEFIDVAKRFPNFETNLILKLEDPQRIRGLDTIQRFDLLEACCKNENTPNAMHLLDALQKLAHTHKDPDLYHKFINVLITHLDNDMFDTKNHTDILLPCYFNCYILYLTKNDGSNALRMLNLAFFHLNSTAHDQMKKDNWDEVKDILALMTELKDREILGLHDMEIPENLLTNIDNYLELIQKEFDKYQHNNDLNDIEIDNNGVDIIFVGCNQRRHQTYVNHINNNINHKNISVTYYPTQWTGKYYEIVPKILRKLESDKYDALVISHHVRTVVGEKLRKDAKKPWTACTGNGRGLMERSILKAARLVRRKRNQGNE